MRVFQRFLTAAMLGLLAAPMVHASTLSIPVESGMIAAPEETGCSLADAGAFSAPMCDIRIPVALPAGTTIQQIKVIYSGAGSTDAALWSINYSTSAMNQPFSTSSFPPTAPGMFGTVALMSQSGKAFPDAFVVQQSTLYRVDVLAEHGVTITGLQVIYQ